MSLPSTHQTTPDNGDHLALLTKGESASVAGMMPGDSPEHAALITRLLELGFTAGETVRVVAESFPQRDPMAVRLGNTTFALRRHEAALVRVVRSNPLPS